MKLTKAIAAFITYVRDERKYAALTVTAYESDLHRLQFHVPMDTVLHVTSDTIKRWIAASSAEGNSPATLHRKIATVRTFGRWGVRVGLWTKSPAEDIEQIPKPKGLPRPFSDAEVAAVLALDLTPRETITRALLLYTGLRVSPICGIKVGDISFAPPTIRALVKGAKVQVIKLHPELVEALRSFVTKHTDGKAYTLILANSPRHHPHRRDVERMTQRWGERAAVPNCTPHRFRHYFATKLLQQTGNLRLVQRAMGHEDISSTALYTFVSDDEEAAAVAQLNFGTKSRAPYSDSVMSPGVRDESGLPASDG